MGSSFASHPEKTEERSKTLMHNVLMHPLAETYPPSPEMRGQATGNTWWTASLFANVAVGRSEGHQIKAVEICTELAQDSTHEGSKQITRLLRQARANDGAMMQVIGIVADGLTARLSKAFGVDS